MSRYASTSEEVQFSYGYGFKGLPISVQMFNERLKVRNVLVIAWHHFFPGLEEAWKHKHECIRIPIPVVWSVSRWALKRLVRKYKEHFRTHAKSQQNKRYHVGAGQMLTFHW